MVTQNFLLRQQSACICRISFEVFKPSSSLKQLIKYVSIVLDALYGGTTTYVSFNKFSFKKISREDYQIIVNMSINSI